MAVSARFGPISAEIRRLRHVCSAPNNGTYVGHGGKSAEGEKQTSHFSFEQLISATRQWQGDGDAERLGSL
jgi:hypothetical protein